MGKCFHRLSPFLSSLLRLVLLDFPTAASTVAHLITTFVISPPCILVSSGGFGCSQQVGPAAVADACLPQSRI